ncbi:hypothetical protein [Streptomyces sp. NPDC058295]|uniref:hypothetical protein n=1 Tax=Streptomyces sp. NPDC058295 TaxID=3346431 RepID=UPI0036E5C312
MPDLAVILTAEPGRIATRIAERGITHRWHLDPTGPSREVDLYRDAAAYLRSRGVQVLLLDRTLTEPEQLQLKTVRACPEIDALTRHVRSFATMLTERQGERLPDWLNAVRQDDLPSLHTLAPASPATSTPSSPD